MDIKPNVIYYLSIKPYSLKSAVHTHKGKSTKSNITIANNLVAIAVLQKWQKLLINTHGVKEDLGH